MIYTTGFKNSTKEVTSPSVNSGLASFAEVLELLGYDFVYINQRMVIYGAGEHRVVYSDFPFQVE